jgi:hypothetical protein
VRFATAILLLALLAAPGCGPRTTSVPTNLTSGCQTRCMLPGDRMVFEVDMDQTDAEMIKSDSGTIIKTVEKGKSHGPSFTGAIAQTVHVTHRTKYSAGMRGLVTHWYGQNPSGAVYFLGRCESGDDWAVAKNPTQCQDVPSVLSKASSWGYTARLTSGQREMIHYEIVGVEKVETPAGVFEAYKAHWRATRASGALMSGYVWVRPEFPLGIKTDAYITSPSAPGTTIHVVESLKSYHLLR